MSFTRRFFLKSSGIALVGVGPAMLSVPGFLTRAAAVTAGRRKTLVVLFQRGAADGLNIVVPHAERQYYKLRPSIAIPRPKRGASETALDLDGFFAFHPALAPLKRLYDDKMLAVINAAGSPDSTRSHFDAQDFMESGTPGVKRTSDGWLNRYLQTSAVRHASSFRAVSVTPQIPRILSGTAPALAIPQLSNFGIRDKRYGDLLQRGLVSLYNLSDDPLFRTTAQEAFEAVQFLEDADPSRYKPENGAEYPGGFFGKNLMQIAQLIKADVGLEVAFAEIAGWDHHVNEGGVAGPLANLLRQFAGGIGAFTRDLGDRMEDVVLITLSEFGRTAQENGNRGTDHGHANAIFVVGGPVKGGKVYGKWPGLKPDRLHERRDLALTTDFRDVIGELLAGHLGARDLDRVFPDHRMHQRRLGLVG